MFDVKYAFKIINLFHLLQVFLNKKFFRLGDIYPRCAPLQGIRNGGAPADPAPF